MRGRPVAARFLAVLALLGGPSLAGSAAAEPAVAAPAVVPPRLDPAPVVAYPRGAKGDADVTLVLTIAKDGQVRSAEVETGAEPFASAAKEAAASWRFEPATREGLPVAAKIRFVVTFHGEKTTPAPAEPEPPQAASKPAPGAKPGAAKAPPKKVDPIEILIRADKLPPAVTSLSRAEVRQIPGTFGAPAEDAVDLLRGRDDEHDAEQGDLQQQRDRANRHSEPRRRRRILMNARIFVSIARGAAAALLFVGCLPGDTRPPPALIHFVVEPSAAVIEGVTTVDGWQITFEKLLVGLGGAGVDNRALCNRYANGGYQRLFDFTVPGKQKLSDAYALGTCDLRFRLRSPGSDALLGQGVTAQDLAFMRIEGKDAVVPLGRKAIHVRGQATRGAVTKRFEWSFSVNLRLGDCLNAPGMGLERRVDLRGGDVLSLSLKVHGEALFRESARDESPLRFDAMADADADGDQAITLEELFLAPGPEPEADAGLASGGVGGPASIGHSLYFLHVPRLVRLGDIEACLVEDS